MSCKQCIMLSMNIILKSLTVGPLATNVYILSDKTTKQAVLIDPGADPDQIQAYIVQHHLTVTKILITHGHFDHIGAVATLSKAFSCPYFAYKGKYLKDPQLNLSSRFPPEVKLFDAVYLSNLARISVSNDCNLQLIATPGHTADSVIYYIDSLKLAFVGDTCFDGALGRTDLPGGDASQLKLSIENVIMQLPEDTKLFPGHGPQTTVAALKSWWV